MSIRIYVGGLSPAAREKDVETIFQDAGIKPESVSVVIDAKRDRSRCFAFVEVAGEEEAEAAITGLNGKELEDRTLKVSHPHRRQEVHGGFGKPEGFKGIHGKDADMKPRRRRRK